VRFSSLIVKNLTRRPARSALTVVALSTAITAVVALLGIAHGFTRSFAEVYSAHGVDIVVSRQGSADRLSSSVDVKYISEIAHLSQVQRAAGVLLESLSFEDEGIYGIPTMGIQRGSWLLNNYQFVGGNPGDPFTVQPPTTQRSDTNASRASIEQPMVILLGVHLAERIGKSRGDTVNLFDEPYTISGVFRSSSVWENGSIILPLDVLQALTDRKGQVTYINVVLQPVDSTDSSEQAISAIQGLDRRLLAMTTSQYVETDTRMQVARAMAWMTSVIAVLIGSISVLNTMLTSVLERTKEIGILRAIGWSKKRIAAMIIGESCGLSLVASLLGIAAAFILTGALSRSPATGGLISADINFPIILQGLVLALTIGLFGALMPAIRATRLSPTEAFRENG
jgi:putative ABC transport system permease protein